MFALSGHPAVLALGVVSALCVLVLLLLLSGFRVIPNDRIGIVEKRWSTRGSVRVGAHRAQRRGGLPARRPARRPALAACRSSTAYTSLPLVTIPQGTHRVRVRARRPAARRRCRRSPRTSRADDFTERRRVPRGGRAARARSASILREGTYAINLAQFVVITDEQGLLPAAKPRGRRRRLPQHGRDRSPSAMASSRS